MKKKKKKVKNDLKLVLEGSIKKRTTGLKFSIKWILYINILIDVWMIINIIWIITLHNKNII